MKTAEDLPRGTAGESPKTGKHAVLPCPSSTGARRTPERVSEGGRAPVEVGDFPFLESIFMIFGKSSAISAEYEILRAISSRNDQK